MHYLGLFRHAKSMLMAEHPVSCVLFSPYARRHMGKRRGREMKVRGIANIHSRQLFMNIKEQLWMVAGSHHFLLIILKLWNTLQLCGFTLRKVCHRRSLAARKEKLNNIDSWARALVSHKRKNVFVAWLFSSVCFPTTADRCRKDMFVCSNEKNSFLHSGILKKAKGKREKKNQWSEKTLPGTSAARWPPSCPLLWLCISLATHEETSGALQDSDTRVNANLGGCDKQSEPVPKSLQMDQHQTR